MKLGTKIGLSFSFIGCAVGAYFGLSPVYSQLQSGVLSGLEAGLTFSITGIFIGVYWLLLAFFLRISMPHNKPINTLTSFAGTHTRGAASPLCPTCLRPLLESYISKLEMSYFSQF